MSKFIEIKDDTHSHSINIDFIVSISEDSNKKTTIYLTNREVVTKLDIEKVKVIIANASPF